MEAKSAVGREDANERTTEPSHMTPVGAPGLSRWLGWTLLVAIAAGALLYMLTR